MRDWLSTINVNPGFLTIVFQEISKFSDKSRHCNLVFDSMSISKLPEWEQWKTDSVGTCDYGNGYTLGSTEECATQALVFMLVSLRGKWKWPIGYFYVNSITATMQCELIKCALELCDQYHIKVWSITCDGAAVNYATMIKLGCELYVTQYLQLKCWFEHPNKKDIVFFVPDACHNIKLARNALGDLKTFRSSTGVIKWKHITALHGLQKYYLNLKIANKLSDAHISYRGNIMKVKYAAQTLSQSTANALNFLKFAEVELFSDCDATVEFLTIVDETFDFFNSRNPFATGYKKPIYMNNINYLQEKIE